MCLVAVIGPYQVLVHVHVLRPDLTQLGPGLPHDAHRPAGGAWTMSAPKQPITHHTTYHLSQKILPTHPSRDETVKC